MLDWQGPESRGQSTARANDGPEGTRRPWHRVFLLLLLLLALAGPQLFLGRDPFATHVTYSAFVALLDSGRVREVVIGEHEIRGVLRRAAGDTTAGHRDSLFVTGRVEDPALASALRARGVVFSAAPPEGLLRSLTGWLIPLMLFAGVWLWLSRRLTSQQAAVFGIGRSGARVYAERNTSVTFADVAGVDEAKAELEEIVAFLRDPASFGRLGAHMPRGVLLVGPPGTGKTLLARAVAGEAGVPFLSINGSEFVELFVGVGAARVRSLFAQARQTAPCIIFIDELDALGRARGPGLGVASHDEKEQALNQLLAELDGFDPERGVVLLAATNRPEILDPALLRAGRFDRQVLVDRPDKEGRRQILAVHVRGVRLAPDLDLEQVAALTTGFSGADLANLVNEAALAATRRRADVVALEDFTAAVERLVAGLARRSRVPTPHEREISAYHEMGHAIVALATPGADVVQKVSIIPRGLGALGYTLQRPSEDRYIATRHELEARLTVLLGGRAAELVKYDELSTGAADDLVRATELAREMVARFGMDSTVGNVVYGDAPTMLFGAPALPAPESRLYSERTAREIELAVRTLLQQALDRAVALLTLHRGALDDGAKRLLERETLTRDELPRVTPPLAEFAPPDAAHARSAP